MKIIKVYLIKNQDLIIILINKLCQQTLYNILEDFIDHLTLRIPMKCEPYCSTVHKYKVKRLL